MANREPRYPLDEFARRGDAIYDKDIRPHLTKRDIGKFLAIDIETGEYEMSRSELRAGNKLIARIPDCQIWMVRIGYKVVRSFGGGNPRDDLP